MQHLQGLNPLRLLVARAPVSQRGVLANIGMLACSGVSSYHVMRAVPVLLRKVMPIDVAGFFWANSAGDMIDVFVETPYLLSAEILLSCIKYQSEDIANWPSFTENVTQGPVVGYLKNYQTAKFYESEHFYHTYEKIGVRHILDAVVHDGSRPYGAFLLMRSAANGDFNAQEISLINNMLCLLNFCFQLPAVTHIVTHRTYEAGLLILDETQKILFCNLTAHQILWMLTRGDDQPFSPQNSDDLVTLIAKVCVDGVRNAMVHGSCRAQHSTYWGEFFIVYQWDAVQRTVAIKLTQLQPFPCYLAMRLAAEKLSQTRMMTTWLLVQGVHRKEIAHLLNVSVFTAAEHIQSVFKHFQVNAITDLMRRLYQ